MELLPLLVGACVAFVVVRHAAVRRVAAGRGNWVWLMFGPTLIGGVVVLWAAGRVLIEDTLLGVALTIGGVLYLASVAFVIDRTARGVSAAKSSEEVELAVTEPMSDHLVRLIGVTLIGGLIAVVALVIYGVMRAASH